MRNKGLVNNQNGDLKYLVDLTVGVVLLGCPLKGSSMAWLSRLIAWIMSPRGSHTGIIQQLGYGNSELRDTLISFQILAKSIWMPYFCFYEQLPTDYGTKFGISGLIRGLVCLVALYSLWTKFLTGCKRGVCLHRRAKKPSQYRSFKTK